MRKVPYFLRRNKYLPLVQPLYCTVCMYDIAVHDNFDSFFYLTAPHGLVMYLIGTFKQTYVEYFPAYKCLNWHCFRIKGLCTPNFQPTIMLCKRKYITDYKKFKIFKLQDYDISKMKSLLLFDQNTVYAKCG
jgi:hypothetical protein